jgi:hypothetical protein
MLVIFVAGSFCLALRQRGIVEWCVSILEKALLAILERAHSSEDFSPTIHIPVIRHFSLIPSWGQTIETRPAKNLTLVFLTMTTQFPANSQKRKIHEASFLLLNPSLLK